jgi:hypothetical protein
LWPQKTAAMGFGRMEFFSGVWMSFLVQCLRHLKRLAQIGNHLQVWKTLYQALQRITSVPAQGGSTLVAGTSSAAASTETVSQPAQRETARTSICDSYLCFSTGYCSRWPERGSESSCITTPKYKENLKLKKQMRQGKKKQDRSTRKHAWMWLKISCAGRLAKNTPFTDTDQRRCLYS